MPLKTEIFVQRREIFQYHVLFEIGQIETEISYGYE
jgi:hypothetical protein